MIDSKIKWNCSKTSEKGEISNSY